MSEMNAILLVRVLSLQETHYLLQDAADSSKAMLRRWTMPSLTWVLFLTTRSLVLGTSTLLEISALLNTLNLLVPEWRNLRIMFPATKSRLTKVPSVTKRSGMCSWGSTAKRSGRNFFCIFLSVAYDNAARKNTGLSSTSSHLDVLQTLRDLKNRFWRDWTIVSFL